LSYERDKDAGRGAIVIPTPYIYLHSTGDRLFVNGGNQREFQIEVFDRSGNPLPPVKMPYERLKLSASFKNELLDWFKSDPRFRNMPPAIFQRLHFLEILPAIRDVFAAHTPEGGRVYVQTYARQAENSEFFVFDFKGKLLKKAFLPTTPGAKVKLNHERVFTFHNDKYYYLLENPETEEWELHMQELN